MRASRLLLLAFVGLIAVGCEAGNTFLKSVPSYYPTAQQNYEYGLKELKAQNWLTAIQYFNHVKNAFGFSKWATLAELGLADANLGRDKYTEAIDGYKQFIKAHPNHEHVLDGYAAFKIGECYYKQIPSDWFLAPPSYEKDQGPVLDALRELTAFTESNGESPYVPKARQLMGDCVRRLADHELYVAQFYLDRDKPYAAIGRLEGLLRDYPGARREPETLLLLGKTYLKMEKPKEAREVFEKLAGDHPDDYRAAKAKLYIQFIDKKIGPKS
ncbi:MAG TPA: outer membrane protein assembly factor BamD [Polyangia bacterium]|nr:outer membrane protein assembly factor BamD [Polyangia bacterium]